MKEELIGFEVAKLAKEKGFEGVCDYWYYTVCGLKDSCGKVTENTCNKKLCSICYSEDDCIPKLAIHKCCKSDYQLSAGNSQSIIVPTQSLLQKWLREKHKIHLVCWWYDKEDKFYTELGKRGENTIRVQTGNVTNLFDTYEAALEAGLLEALKLI